MHYFKKFQKLIAIAMIAALCLSLSGCGLISKLLFEDETESHATSETTAPAATAVSSIFSTGETRDKQVTLKGDGSDTTTILIYMNGSNLESEDGEATLDISEMISAGSSENVTVLVETIGTSRWQNYGISSDRTQIYKLDGSGLTLVNDELGYLSVYDASSLNSFITWGVTNYPADRYELILWDHGGGPVYGFGYDDNSYDSDETLSLDEIQKALYYSGVYFDFIGFDACIMASLEVCCALYDYCDYMIVSEDFESGYGWYYTNWLKELYANPSAEATDLGQIIVSDTVSYNKQRNSDGSIMAVIDQSVMKVLYSAWTTFAYANEEALMSANYSQEIQQRGRGAVSSDIDNDLVIFGLAGGDESSDETLENYVSIRPMDDWGMGSMVSWSENNVTMEDYYVTDIMAVASTISSDESEALASALNAAIVYMESTEDDASLTGLSATIPYGDSSFYSDLVTVFTNCGFDEDYINWLGNFIGVASSSYSDYYSFGDFDQNWNGWGSYDDSYDWGSWEDQNQSDSSGWSGIFSIIDSFNEWLTGGYGNDGYDDNYEQNYGDQYYQEEYPGGDYYGEGDYFFGGDYYDYGGGDNWDYGGGGPGGGYGGGPDGPMW